MIDPLCPNRICGVPWSISLFSTIFDGEQVNRKCAWGIRDRMFCTKHSAQRPGAEIQFTCSLNGIFEGFWQFLGFFGCLVWYLLYYLQVKK